MAEDVNRVARSANQPPSQCGGNCEIPASFPLFCSKGFRRLHETPLSSTVTDYRHRHRNRRPAWHGSRPERDRQTANMFSCRVEYCVGQRAVRLMARSRPVDFQKAPSVDLDRSSYARSSSSWPSRAGLYAPKASLPARNCFGGLSIAAILTSTSPSLAGSPFCLPS